MNNLITGGAGFIGSHLCEKLLEMGEEVTAIDNFFTGTKQNIKHLMDNPNFELIRHDITESLLIETDRIYHLACPASPIHYQRDPVKTVETNVVGTNNMLKIAERTGARILLASTSEVYGNPEVHPQPESYYGHVNPISIRACYDEGKRVAETLMFDYHRERGVDIRVARIFNTYGPRMSENDGRVVSNFIIQALKNQAITVFGNGKQTRSFCYVDDMVDGLISLMDNFTHMGPVNLGNPDERTIIELVGVISGLLEKRLQIEFCDLPCDDPERRKPNIDRAKQFLKWEPEIELNEGIKKTIKYFREIIK
jgi:UDP-glucuronate decarboxylase